MNRPTDGGGAFRKEHSKPSELERPWGPPCQSELPFSAEWAERPGNLWFHSFWLQETAVTPQIQVTEREVATVRRGKQMLGSSSA
jgi:hypothetical protein